MASVFYNATGGYASLGSWSNSSSNKVKITAITLDLGVGAAGEQFTEGDAVTGTGSSITTHLAIGSNTSDLQTITNTVSAIGSAGHTYPDSSDFSSYTFTFSDGVEVDAGSSVNVSIKSVTNSVLCGSLSLDVTAVDVISTFTVTYNANGGLNPPLTQTSTDGSVIIASGTSMTAKPYTIYFDYNYTGSPDVEEKVARCRFNRWNTSKTGDGTWYSEGSIYSGPGDLTLYAIWTDPVVSDLASDFLPEPTRTGYSFLGWNTESGGEGTKIDETYQFSWDITLYAIWSVETFTITYDANGGSDAPSPTSGTLPLKIASQQPTRSITVTYDANGGSGVSSSAVHTLDFEHWCTTRDGSGVEWYPDETYSNAESITLYAIWSTWSLSASSLPTPTKAGSTFIGWYYSGTSTKADVGDALTEDTTLVAQWTTNPTFTITYDANGGNSAPTDTVGELPLTLSSATPYKYFILRLDAAGGTLSSTAWALDVDFLRWDTNPNGSGTSYAPGDTYNIEADDTLYAIWAEESSAITSAMLKEPTRSGFTFAGWYYSDDTAVNVGDVLTEDTTIVAHWSEDPTPPTSSAIWIMTTTGWQPYDGTIHPLGG